MNNILNQRLSQDDIFKLKIKKLNETVWEYKIAGNLVDDWLNNFQDNDLNVQAKERFNALYLLSKFMYFGIQEIREMIKCLYRDNFKYPIVESIRKNHRNTQDTTFIETEFNKELKKTLFLGLGNPSDSSSHLMYYLRQENGLSRKLFIDKISLLERKNGTDIFELKNLKINRLVVVDDFCGSGSQAKEFVDEILNILGSKNSNIEFYYLMLFATEDGIRTLQNLKVFKKIESVFVFDKTYKCFESFSRYFNESISGLDKDFTKNMCIKYSKFLRPSPTLRLKNYDGLGHNKCQLITSFFHNTPDNTLPIFWYDDILYKWKPIFKRYPKIY